MKQLSLEDLASVSAGITAWAVCWMVTDKAGGVFRATGHDADIEVSRTINGIDLSGTYRTMLSIQSTMSRQASDMSVDNLDVDVLLDEYGITAADIRAGLFDNVEYTIFLVNWRDPTNSGIIVRNGLVGNFRSFANGLATGEARGLKQALSQTIIEAYSLTCRAQLGDERCKVNLAPYTLTGEVASVINRRRITITLDSGAPEPGDYTGGLLTLTSGANAGYQQEIKLDSAADVFGTIELFEPFPYEVQAGDTLTLTPGCNKIHQVVDGVAVGDCKNRYDNVVNFRGEPFIPGTAEILRGGSV